MKKSAAKYWAQTVSLTALAGAISVGVGFVNPVMAAYTASTGVTAALSNPKYELRK